jgi:hypothetical protein
MRNDFVNGNQTMILMTALLEKWKNTDKINGNNL